MAGRDNERKGPNPAFLKTRRLGSGESRNVDSDDRPTGIDLRSEKPAPVTAPRVDPNDVFYLTDRPGQAKLPSFDRTAPGPGSGEPPGTRNAAPRRDLPPVASLLRPNAVRPNISPLAHSPAPERVLPATWPTPPIQPAPSASSVSQPMPLVRRSTRPAVSGETSAPATHQRKRGRVWKPVLPAPRFPASEPLMRVIPPRPDVLLNWPKPVEDRLLNALGVLFVGMAVATLAGWSFLAVTNTRAGSLSSFISEPILPAASNSAGPAASLPLPGRTP